MVLVVMDSVSGYDGDPAGASGSRFSEGPWSVAMTPGESSARAKSKEMTNLWTALTARLSLLRHRLLPGDAATQAATDLSVGQPSPKAEPITFTSRAVP